MESDRHREGQCRWGPARPRPHGRPARRQWRRHWCGAVHVGHHDGHRQLLVCRRGDRVGWHATRPVRSGWPRHRVGWGPRLRRRHAPPMGRRQRPPAGDRSRRHPPPGDAGGGPATATGVAAPAQGGAPGRVSVWRPRAARIALILVARSLSPPTTAERGVTENTPPESFMQAGYFRPLLGQCPASWQPDPSAPRWTAGNARAGRAIRLHTCGWSTRAAALPLWPVGQRSPALSRRPLSFASPSPGTPWLVSHVPFSS